MPPTLRRPSRDFKLVATTEEEEVAYDIRAHRESLASVKFTGITGSIAHLVKGALGGGILSAHVAYLKGGVAWCVPLNIFFGVYMGYCLYLLVTSSQMLYRRTRIPVMSYADVGEATCLLFPNPTIQKCGKYFRYAIDAIISLDLFGSCCCYQLIIAKQLKQLVENTQDTSMAGKGPGYPDMRVYLALMIPLVIAICLIRHLKYLAPFSILANLVVLLACLMTVYYAFVVNPRFENIILTTSAYGIFEYIGMAVFSMSCAGVVIPIENNMNEPLKFPIALGVGMGAIIMGILSVSFFGVSAFGAKSVSPITLNFPMTTLQKALKGLIALMIYVTHALNFWVPFNLCFYYLKRLHKPEQQVTFELIYRAIFVTVIGIIAIVFPEIEPLMGFLGCFCLSNMAFIWPNIICLLTIWDRPGLGAHRWKLWRGVVLITLGIFIFICGSVVNAQSMVEVFININLK